MESTAIVVACAPYASERVPATVSARSLLPAAVGPQTTRAFLFSLYSVGTPSSRSVSVGGPLARLRRGRGGPHLRSWTLRTCRVLRWWGRGPRGRSTSHR